MIFSSPSFLWALGLLGIPIIIHLFQFRKHRQILFSDISLLKQVQTQSQTKNQLKHLLLLLLRLLTIAFIVLAFAEPEIPAESQIEDSTPPVVTVFIDNSLSMQNESENVKLLKQAQQDAYQIIESYDRGTQFQLITHDLDSKTRRIYDSDGIIEAIDDVDFTNKTMSLTELIRHHQSQKVEHEYENSVVYYLSDFNSKIDSLTVSIDSTTFIRLVKYSGDFNHNISIDSAWIEEPIIQVGTPLKINVQITNHGNRSVNDQVIDLNANNQDLGSINLNLDAQSSIDTHLTATLQEPLPYLTTISTEDVPITFDDAYYMVVEPKKNIKVVEIHSESSSDRPFEKLFSDDGSRYVRFTENSIIQDSLSGTNMVIFNSLEDWSSGYIALAKDALSSGQNVLICLPQQLSEASKTLIEKSFDLSISSWNKDTIEANKLALRNGLFSDVFESVPENLNYPIVHGYHTLNGSNLERIVELYNGDALFYSSKIDNGYLYIIPTKLDQTYTNFHNHALFVPTVFNAALQSGKDNPLSYLTSKTSVPTNEIISEVPRLIEEATRKEHTLGKAFRGISLAGVELNPGFYGIMDGDLMVKKLAFNIDRRESDLRNRSEEEVLDMFTQSGIDAEIYSSTEFEKNQIINTADMNMELWYWFVLVALLFLTVESVLIKLTKS